MNLDPALVGWIVGLGIPVVGVLIYVGTRWERGRWIGSADNGTFLFVRGKRYFVFDASDFDIMDLRTAQLVGESTRTEKPGVPGLKRRVIEFLVRILEK